MNIIWFSQSKEETKIIWNNGYLINVFIKIEIFIKPIGQNMWNRIIKQKRGVAQEISMKKYYGKF